MEASDCLIRLTTQSAQTTNGEKNADSLIIIMSARVDFSLWFIFSSKRVKISSVQTSEIHKIWTKVKVARSGES